KLNIAIECHNCIQWLIPALRNFQKNWPQVKMNFKSNMVFNAQLELRKGKLDIVITSDILSTSNLFYIPIFDFELRLVLAPDHPLTRKKRTITPNDLASEIFIIYPISKTRLDIWTNFLKPAGVKPIFKNVDNTLLLIQMVSARMGITALPNWVVNNFEKQGLIVTRKLGKGIWGRLYAAILNGKQYETIIQAFINSIKINCADYELKFIKRNLRLK
ncbi:LysR family transcriptional regulator, partial [Buchnera aphidicola (Hormaphis cornu)]